MCRPPSSDRVRQQACGLPYPAFGQRSRSSVALHVCFLTGAPRCRRPGHCPPFHAPIPPATSSGVRRGGGGDSPADGRCTSPVALPRTLPPAVLGAPLPAMLIVRRRRWSSVIGRERRRVRPMTPPSRPRRRFNSDNAGKSTYSDKIDYRFLTFQTGYRFSGSCLTSLVFIWGYGMDRQADCRIA